MTRTLLTLATVAVVAVLMALMWWGYRNRARRQAAVLPAFPTAPRALLDAARAGTAETLLPPSTGVYASTVTEQSWQDRVAVGDVGFRAEATAHLLAEGVLFDRAGADPVWIPADTVVDARTAPGIAGKVMGRDGLLVVRWRLDGQIFDTGFRADDKDDYRTWVAAVSALGAEQTGGQS